MYYVVLKLVTTPRLSGFTCSVKFIPMGKGLSYSDRKGNAKAVACVPVRTNLFGYY